MQTENSNRNLSKTYIVLYNMQKNATENSNRNLSKP